MADNSQGFDTDTILSKFRISRLQAIEIAVIAIVAVVAALIRILPLQYGAYLTAFDPLFQFRATEYVVENGYAAWWTWHDDMSWYPMGRNVANSAYPGVPFTAAFIYGIAKVFVSNLTVHDVALYYPVLMAVLTVIAMYFLGKDIAGSSAGIFAAIFMAITPAYIRRTSLGFFDTENIGILAIVLTSLFFLRANDDRNNIERRIIYSVLSGLSLGLIYASWGAAKYMTGLLMLYMLLIVASEKYDTKYLISYSFSIGLGFLVVALTPRLGPNTLLGMDSLAAFGLVVVLLGYEFVRDKIDVSVVSVGAIGIVIVAVLTVYILPAVGIQLPLGNKFIQVLNPFTSSSSYLYDSVAENHVTAWTSLFNDYGLVLALGVFGSYYSVKELDEKNLYALVFFTTGLYFAGVMSRLTQILAAPACLMGAYGVINVVQPILKPQASQTGSRRARRKSAVTGVNKRLALFFMAFMVLALIPNVTGAIKAADSPTQLASSSMSVQINGEYPQDWPEALDWMKENVADDEVICSWWDYGYWIEAMAGKTTMADGATQTTRQISTIGKIMMSTPEESLQLLERYGADYILVFFTHAPGNVQNSWPFGDNVKWQWMVQIGELDINDYVNYTAGVYNQGFMDSTLVNLMYQFPVEGFVPAFQSENEYVLIYKIEYPETG
ncbi:MAG: STT3 domain-containing protein [Candidatus Bathyarchaeota archaeon]